MNVVLTAMVIGTPEFVLYLLHSPGVMQFPHYFLYSNPWVILIQTSYQIIFSITFLGIIISIASVWLFFFFQFSNIIDIHHYISL